MYLRDRRGVVSPRNVTRSPIFLAPLILSQNLLLSFRSLIFHLILSKLFLVSAAHGGAKLEKIPTRVYRTRPGCRITRETLDKEIHGCTEYGFPDAVRGQNYTSNADLGYGAPDSPLGRNPQGGNRIGLHLGRASDTYHVATGLRLRWIPNPRNECDTPRHQFLNRRVKRCELRRLASHLAVLADLGRWSIQCE